MSRPLVSRWELCRSYGLSLVTAWAFVRVAAAWQWLQGDHWRWLLEPIAAWCKVVYYAHVPRF